MNQQQQWYVVVDKKKSRENNKKKKVIHQISSIPLHSQHLNYYLQKFQASQIKKFIQTSLHKLISQFSYQSFSIQIQALGLGNIFSQKKSRIQFQLLLIMITTIKQIKNIGQLKVNLYDPVFNNECYNMVKKIDKCTCLPIQKIESNAQLIIWYMPHCQKQLYKQILEKQGNNKIIIIGNSLKQYNERQKLLGLKQTQIFKFKAFVEIKIPDFQGAFNDTFIMY